MSDDQAIRYEHYEVYVREDGSPWELGRGAMGVTYKAFDTSLHSDVALKVISEKCFANPTARKRFEREARAAAKLRHPNIASVFHFGTGETGAFYAMELVEGDTVEQLIRQRGTIPTRKALEIVLQVGRALGAAERHHIVHRDLKPANIMLHDEDGELVVKVIDFGLAKQLDNPRDAGVTVRGFVGTPHFASPEQLNERTLDQRSDIYSLGATLWHMLAGRPPFTGTVVQIVSQHLSAPVPTEMLRDQPAAVRRLLERMLAKDPADRPQTTSELRQLVQDTLAAVRAGSGVAASAPSHDDDPTELDTREFEEPVATPTTAQIRTVDPRELTHMPEAPPEIPPSRPRRRAPVAIVLAILAGTLVLGGIAWTVLHPAETHPATEPPEQPVVANTTPDQFSDKIDAAWKEERYADAISLCAIASNRIPDGPARLEDMVRKATAEHGEIPPPELRAALTDAAEAGSPTAMRLVANALAEQYPFRAAIWYEKAANLGDATAMTKLGLLCAKGIGNYPPDEARAVPWFETASDAGDPEGQFALAECYLRGLGSVTPDPEKALRLLRLAADRDYPRALDLLGTCYSKGEVVARDYHEAYRRYERAVELNYAPAMANLGVLLMNGHGPDGEPDPTGAVQLFERGANAGDPQSMLYYATALEGGHGVKADPEKARTWYIAAAKAGHPRAKQWCREQKIEGF